MNVAIIFPTPDTMFEAMFGPPQQDAHVSAYRRVKHAAEQQKWLDAADERLNAATARIIARMREGTHG